MVKLTVYDIIKKTRLSNKTKEANKNEYKIIIEVHINANKVQIKQAVTMLFGAEVLSVNVLVIKGKNKKSASRYIYKNSDYKKAIVKIKKGLGMDILSSSNEEFASDLNSNNNIQG